MNEVYDHDLGGVPDERQLRLRETLVEANQLLDSLDRNPDMLVDWRKLVRIVRGLVGR